MEADKVEKEMAGRKEDDSFISSLSYRNVIGLLRGETQSVSVGTLGP